MYARNPPAVLSPHHIFTYLRNFSVFTLLVLSHFSVQCTNKSHTASFALSSLRPHELHSFSFHFIAFTLFSCSFTRLLPLSAIFLFFVVVRVCHSHFSHSFLRYHFCFALQIPCIFRRRLYVSFLIRFIAVYFVRRLSIVLLRQNRRKL